MCALKTISVWHTWLNEERKKTKNLPPLAGVSTKKIDYLESAAMFSAVVIYETHFILLGDCTNYGRVKSHFEKGETTDRFSVNFSPRRGSWVQNVILTQTAKLGVFPELLKMGLGKGESQLVPVYKFWHNAKNNSRSKKPSAHKLLFICIFFSLENLEWLTLN